MAKLSFNRLTYNYILILLNQIKISKKYNANMISAVNIALTFCTYTGNIKVMLS